MSKEAVLAQPLTRADMPTDYAISLDTYIGRQGIGGGYMEGETRIPGDFGPVQKMRGFEKIYPNIIDYIVRITYKIWEDRDVEYIADTYHDNSHVFDDYGLQLGNRKIIADTHHTTGAFSDIRLIADEIVWAGNDEIGYHTSHRTLIRGVNDGDSKHGPATGRNVDVLVIANCVSRENEIFLEHVLYNNSCLVKQLGLDLQATAAVMAVARPAGWPRDEGAWKALRDAARPQRPLYQSEPGLGFDVDAFTRSNWNALWNQGDDQALHNNYAADFPCAGPGGRIITGAASYHDFIAGLRQCFPDLEVGMDEVYWMGNEGDGFLSAERWSANATHRGPGIFGEPTDCRVQLWGITQHRIRNGVIEQEWMLFNELELMMQIAAARGGNQFDE